MNDSRGMGCKAARLGFAFGLRCDGLDESRRKTDRLPHAKIRDFTSGGLFACGVVLTLAYSNVFLSTPALAQQSSTFSFRPNFLRTKPIQAEANTSVWNCATGGAEWFSRYDDTRDSTAPLVVSAEISTLSRPMVETTVEVSKQSIRSSYRIAGRGAVPPDCRLESQPPDIVGGHGQFLDAITFSIEPGVFSPGDRITVPVELKGRSDEAATRRVQIYKFFELYTTPRPSANEVTIEYQQTDPDRGFPTATLYERTAELELVVDDTGTGLVHDRFSYRLWHQFRITDYPLPTISRQRIEGTEGIDETVADFGPLPSGLSCTSDSGVIPACDDRRVIVTQAAFQSDSDTAPLRLINRRTTAIIVDKGNDDEGIDIELEIRRNSQGASQIVYGPVREDQFDTGDQDSQKVFYCSRSNNYCNLEKNSAYIFDVTFGSEAIESQEVNVLEASALTLLFLPVFFQDCALRQDGLAAAEACGLARSELVSLVSESNRFIRSTFPIADTGLSLSGDVENAPIGSSFYTDGAITGDPFLFESGYINALAQANKVLSKFRRGTSIAKVVAVVPTGTFSNRGRFCPILKRNCPFIRGGASPLWFDSAVVVEADTGGNTVAHEIGHLLGLPVGPEDEEYVLDLENGTLTNLPASGFDVYQGKEKLERVNFMGGETAEWTNRLGEKLTGDDIYWVNEETWGHLVDQFTSQRVDPRLIHVSFIISSDRSVTQLPWYESEGVPKSGDTGSHSVVAFDQLAQPIDSFFFTPDFRFLGNPLGVSEESPETVINAEFVLSEKIKSIRMYDEFGVEQFSIDPFEKLVFDSLDTVVRACDIGDDEADEIRKSLSEYRASIDDGTINPSGIDQLSTYPDLIKGMASNECNFGPTEYWSFEDFSERNGFVLDLLRARLNSSGPGFIAGDLDQDGDVDRDDLNILLGRRNQPANGENDPSDLDGDGRITGLDARKLVQLCTRSRCAAE